MTRLYVVVEGPTERLFTEQILRPHLERLLTHSFITAVVHKERFTYAGLKKDVRRLLGGPGSAVAVTTMIDLYKIPADFPGRQESEREPLRRVEAMEAAFARDIADARFIPYLQLHEFEALVLCGLRVLEDLHSAQRAEIRDLERRVNEEFQSPEDVDRLQAPSRRILQAIPGYVKTVDGIHVVNTVGIGVLREKCRHFGAWIRTLENLPQKAHSR